MMMMVIIVTNSMKEKSVGLCVHFISFLKRLKRQKRFLEDESLNESTNESDHSETSVNDFLFLAPQLIFGRQLGQNFGSPFDVSGDGFIVVMLVEVGGFDDSDREQDLDVDTPSNLLDGTENVCAGVSVTGEVDAGLLYHHTYNGDHTDTSVLDFGPTCVSQVALDVGKTHRIESHITRHGSIEFVGSDQERDGL